jgi:predicted transcriptional regulator
MEQYIEDAYFDALIKEGLDPEVLGFIQELSEVNQRSNTYFIMQALEEFTAHLDQNEEFSEITFTTHH